MNAFVLLALLAGLLVAPAPSPGATAREWRLRVDGEAQAIRFADLDGDLDLDACIAVVKRTGPAPERSLQLFLRSEQGYPELPDAVIPVSDQVFWADLADLAEPAESDGSGAARLLLLDPHGLNAVDCTSGRPGLSDWADWADRAKPVVQVESFFRGMRSDRLLFADIARDLDLDGRLDLLLPGREGYVFYRGRPDGGFQPGQLLESAREHGIRKNQSVFFSATSRLPRPTPVDWEGDGVGDLLLAYDRKLTRIRLAAGESPGPAEELLDLARLLDPSGAAGDGLGQTTGRILDIDGRPGCELLLTQRVARPNLMAGVATRTMLYHLEDLDRSGASKPRQVIRTDGVTSPPRLFDLDLDGALDLIVTTVRTDLMTRLRESLLSTAQVTIFVYRFERDERRFGAEPIFSESLAMPADRLLDVGAYGWVTFQADYDGDGRPDFASYDAEQGRLRVRRGTARSSWFRDVPIAYEDDSLFEIEVLLNGPFFGQDLDGDGRAEIISCAGDLALIVELP